VTLPSLVRRPTIVTVFAAAGLALTFGAMTVFDLQSTLGSIAFAPWVGLIGLDSGLIGGILATAVATGLWISAVEILNGTFTFGQFVIRLASFAVLGIGAGIVGERLRRSEAMQRNVSALQAALIDSTLDGICLTDAGGNILISNAPMRRLSVELGMPQHGTIVERLLAMSHRLAEPERYQRRMRELAASVDQESSDEFELAGTGRSFRGYTAPVYNQVDTLVGRVWTLRDVTADRELDRMRDAFVATVSHELRTPLTSISGFLEMLQDEEAGLGESGRTYLEVIRRSTSRLHQLVEELLLIAQIEARRVELEPVRLDLAELASHSVEALRPVAAEGGVSIELAVDERAPVRGDARRLAQVIDNLITNAVKFTPSGGSINVSVQDGAGDVHLIVADTGIGIPAEEQGQVFSRFFRSSNATQGAIAGTGLGLAISRALVEQHDGTISLESEEGVGTRVTVTLPADVSELE
jgi:signal transduction histidine kinase